MRAGKKQRADPGSLYAVAHQLYWDFRQLSEGRYKTFVDHKKRLQLEDAAKKAQPQLTDDERAHLRKVVEREIRDGRLQEIDREDRIREVEEGQLDANRFGLFLDAGEQASRDVRVLGEAEIIRELSDPNTRPERIREICVDAFTTRQVTIEPGVTKEVKVRNWPISPMSMLPSLLSEHAEEYCEALKDPRFPRCDIKLRPTNRLKQFWFLSRALAGAAFGYKTRTAINLVGSLRPEQAFEESHGAKPARRQRKLRRKS